MSLAARTLRAASIFLLGLSSALQAQDKPVILTLDDVLVLASKPDLGPDDFITLLAEMFPEAPRARLQYSGKRKIAGIEASSWEIDTTDHSPLKVPDPTMFRCVHFDGDLARQLLAELQDIPGLIPPSAQFLGREYVIVEELGTLPNDLKSILSCDLSLRQPPSALVPEGDLAARLDELFQDVRQTQTSHLFNGKPYFLNELLAKDGPEFGHSALSLLKVSSVDNLGTPFMSVRFISLELQIQS